MHNVIAASNSSISFHKTNFWIDPVSKNQYYVGVQYPEKDIDSVQMIRDIPITGHKQGTPITVGDLATSDAVGDTRRHHAPKPAIDDRHFDGSRSPRPRARLGRRDKGHQRLRCR